MVWELRNEMTGKALELGEEVETSRGEKATLRGFTAPKTEASTGRVHIWLDGIEQSFYPSVIGANIVWVE